ncbi:MAG: hypothetical protein ACYYK0_03660 [Candidatus Eutrophobiaceae bacterium]
MLYPTANRRFPVEPSGILHEQILVIIDRILLDGAVEPLDPSVHFQASRTSPPMDDPLRLAVGRMSPLNSLPLSVSIARRLATARHKELPAADCGMGRRREGDREAAGSRIDE